MAPTTTNPNDLTRQQLDELDTLLQRMLSLPLNKPDLVPMPPKVELPLPPSPAVVAARVSAQTQLPTPPFPEPPAAWSAPMPPARQTFLPLTPAPEPAWEPEPEPAADFAPGPSDFRTLNDLLPFPIPDERPGGPGTLRGVDAPATPIGFRSAMPPMEVAPSPIPEPFAPRPVMTPPPVAGSGLFAPVALLNRVIEGVLGWCGPLGGLLTSPPVKRLLGVTGLVLMAASGWWVARGMGWVSWPQ